MSGPLHGLKVLELAGLGPAPHAAMVLADLGADVVRVDRPAGQHLTLGRPSNDVLLRGRSRTLVADLKSDEGRDMVLALATHADVLIEGLRPGVAERLGVGPDACLAANPRLVYARVTGWGGSGPMAASVGHDINYVGLTGALLATGRRGSPPPPPLNLVGDFGGGSMLLLVGILSALYERSSSGLGQVVDAAMVDGTALLSQMIMSLRGMGRWSDEREDNLLDGGTPFYDTYECADGRYVAVGALEPHFFEALMTGLGLSIEEIGAQYDRTCWPLLREHIAARLLTRTRDEWAEHFAGTDACVTPVLTYAEATVHPHLAARGTYVDVDGVMQAAPAPRFSRTAADSPRGAAATDTDDPADVLAAWAIGQRGSVLTDP